MSTRCNILIRDQDGNELWFYRHSDGYPSGVSPTLCKFLEWVIVGKIRKDATQASGWLILLGASEYQTLSPNLFSQHGKESWKFDNKDITDNINSFVPLDWKCGAYEPTIGQHGYIDYLYIIDLENEKIEFYHVKARSSDNELIYTMSAKNIDEPLPAELD